MAQKSYTKHQPKSDFPIFDYLEMVMPNRLLARWMELPRHYRWTIVSIIASAVALWLFLRIVVGGLHAYLDSQIPRGYDALYLTYDFEARPLPQVPANMSAEMPFVVLPQMIGEQYALQMPLSKAEIEAADAAELESLLMFSLPAQESLTAIQQSLTTALQAQTEASAVDTETAAANVETSTAPDATDPAQEMMQQQTAVNAALAQISALHIKLADADSIEPVYDMLPQLQSTLMALTPVGVALPEVDMLNSRLAELSAVEPPATYSISECLVSSKPAARASDTVQPCVIDQTATFVESGVYRSSTMSLNVTAAQYADHDSATAAVKQVFQYARSIGSTGNFSLGSIAYDYAYTQANDLFTLTWSHANWVYSITVPDVSTLDTLVAAFPY